MKKIFYICMALTISVGSFAYAARTTVLLYGSAGGQFCTDESGVHTNPDGSVFATGVTVGTCPSTPPPPPPFNQITSGSITYRYNLGTVNGVDFTQWKNIVGRLGATQPIVDWPYTNGSTPSLAIAANRVIAAKIVVPANANTVSHALKNVSYWSSAGVTVAVSTIPGDFNPSQTACVKHNAANNDQPMIWLRAGGTVNNSICRLTPGAIYYMNIKFENPAQGGPVTLTWM